MDTYTIYLKNGKEITFQAKKFAIKYSNLDGSATGYEFEGAKGYYPLFLDVSQIVAVTVLKS